MNYQLIHDSIIDRAKTRVLPKEVYTERHHIIPRCMGGTDDKSNLVDLTAKEHFIVHKLIVDIFPNEFGLVHAYYLFVNGTNKNNHNGNEYYCVGAKEYERVKILRSKVMSETMTGSNEDFLIKADVVHGDTYDYSKTQYKGIKKQITIICRVHGEFSQSAHSHLLGRGCKDCGKLKSLKAIIGRKLPKETYKIIGDKQRSTKDEFVNKSTKIHGDVYNYSKVVYVNAHTKVIIGCKEHGDFTQIPNKHLSGRGCQKCGFTKNGLKTKERMSNGKSYKSLKVINKETGEVFVSIKDAAQSNGINVMTLQSKVGGRRTNNTPFVLV